jgi:hypothetical protein
MQIDDDAVFKNTMKHTAKAYRTGRRREEADTAKIYEQLASSAGKTVGSATRCRWHLLVGAEGNAVNLAAGLSARSERSVGRIRSESTEKPSAALPGARSSSSAASPSISRRKPLRV